LKNFGGVLAPVAGVISSFTSTGTDCKVMNKFNKIIDQIQAVSQQIRNLENVVKCESVKQIYNDLQNELGKMVGALKASYGKANSKYIIDDACERGIASVYSRLITQILSKENALKYLQSCVKYKTDDVKSWTNMLISYGFQYVWSMVMCGQKENPINQFIQDFSNLVDHYTKPESIKINSVNNEDFVQGIRDAIGTEADAYKANSKLKQTFNGFDWDVVFYDWGVGTFDRHICYHCENDPPKCLSGAFFFRSDKYKLKNNRNALVSWHTNGKLSNKDIDLSQGGHKYIGKRESLGGWGIPKEISSAKTVGDLLWKRIQDKAQFLLVVEGDVTIDHSGSGLATDNWNTGHRFQIYAAGYGSDCNQKEENPPSVDPSNTPVVLSQDAKNSEKLDELKDQSNRNTDQILQQGNQIEKKVDYWGQKNDDDHKKQFALLTDIKSDTTEIKADLKEVKADVKEIKHDVKEIKADVIEIKADVKQIKADVTEIKGDVKQIKGDVTEIKGDVKEIKTQISSLDTTVKQGFSELGQKVSSGFSEVKQGQKVIMEKVDSVSKDVNYYGQAGIKERAEILQNVKQYGELGIQQHKQSMQKLNVLHNDIGDVRKTQLDECYKSAVRFEQLKSGLIDIKGIQLEEAKKSEYRFNIVSGGINDLKSMSIITEKNNQYRFNALNDGIFDIRNNLKEENIKSEQRFNSLNYGLDRIMNHAIIQSQITEKRFDDVDEGVINIRKKQTEEAILSTKRFECLTNQAETNFRVVTNGISDIRHAQDIYSNAILFNQKIESVVGYERFRHLKGSLSNIIHLLSEEGLKTDNIIEMLIDEKKTSSARFNWITSSFDQLNKQQNLTLFILNEIYKSIDVKSTIISNSFKSTIKYISKLDDSLNNKYKDIMTILNNIQKDLQEKTTKIDVETIFKINGYVDKILNVKLLWSSFERSLQFNTTWSNKQFEKKCSDKDPEDINNYFYDQFYSTVSSNFKSENILNSFVTISKFSFKKFSNIMKEILNDANKAYLINLVCLQNRHSDPVPQSDYDLIVKKSDENLKQISNKLVLTKYKMASMLQSEEIEFLVKDFILKTKLQSNSDVSASLFNYLIINHEWYEWAVFINDNLKGQHFDSFSNKKDDKFLFTGGSIRLKEILNGELKEFTIFWKPFAKNYKQKLIENEIWHFLHDEIKKNLNNENQKSFYISNIVDIIKDNLNLKSVKYCSIFTIIHELNTTDEEKASLFGKSHLNSRYNLNSLDSRVLIIKLNNNDKITMEIFIDVNSCEQGQIIKENTNIDAENFVDYEFITKMPCFELATNELDVATELISSKLIDFFRNLWTVMIVTNADSTNTNLSIKTDFKKIHLSKFIF